jgi:hypothetical protein
MWTCYEPVFACDSEFREMMAYGTWSGHRPFAYDYVRNIKPGRIAELGCFYGCSTFAFLQAVLDGGLDTRFYAVDSWIGDAFTASDYREDVSGVFRRILEKHYAGLDVRVMQTTFDRAALEIEDRSLDLIHIDGSHRYEDVAHDFDVWRPKLKDDGAIFFHDTGEDLLYGSPMGSRRFFEDLKKEEGGHMEFPFSFGLGVWSPSAEKIGALKRAVDPGHYQQLVNLRDSEQKDALRRDYFLIRDLCEFNEWLEEQNRELEDWNRYLEDRLREENEGGKEIADHEETKKGGPDQCDHTCFRDGGDPGEVPEKRPGPGDTGNGDHPGG